MVFGRNRASRVWRGELDFSRKPTAHPDFLQGETDFFWLRARFRGEFKLKQPRKIVLHAQPWFCHAPPPPVLSTAPPGFVGNCPRPELVLAYFGLFLAILACLGLFFRGPPKKHGFLGKKLQQKHTVYEPTRGDPIYVVPTQPPPTWV